MSDDRLERIESKLDKVVEHISSIDSTLAAQHVSLDDHIRRTELLEKDVAPLKAHDNMRAGAFKLTGLVLGLCAAIEGIVMLLEYLRK